MLMTRNRASRQGLQNLFKSTGKFHTFIRRNDLNVTYGHRD
jgi:hypothetical protein